MNELLRPAELQARARAAGLTIREWCERAGIAQSTFTRWKSGYTVAINVNYYQALLDVVLAAERGRITATPKMPLPSKGCL